MPGRVAEVVAISALAAIVAAAIAAPVLRSPSERMFGMEIVGRHYDPFAVMEQFERPIGIGMYSQPVTDVAGAVLARAAGPVAAYNWLILFSFPLSAAAAYLLARHLTLSPVAAGVAAIAFAFSPFHLAQAAYHPHVAQTQWIPLYLLALWRCLDDASPVAVAFLGIATIAVTLSNFYGGLIAAVITPFAIGGYALVRPQTTKTRTKTGSAARSLFLTIGALAVVCAAGFAYVWWVARGVVVDSASFTMASGDVFRYSAKWWSFLVPPVAHPLLGAFARHTWMAADVREGLLEQQVSLGWGIVALGVVALFRSPVAAGDDRRPSPLAYTPLLAVVAIAALACSLAPEPTTWGIRLVRPSALLHAALPMFRAYARFGVVVQLMAALLAAIGIERLWRARTRTARIACGALVALAMAEYAVWPPALWRDVLPTAAHRWITRQPGTVRALDCSPFNQESESVLWLTGYRVVMLGGAITDCAEPDLSGKLAANEYTHVLLRRDTADGPWIAGNLASDGFRLAATFDDGQVLAVTAHMPGIYTRAMTGFSPREHDAEWTWRWMGDAASWTIVNTGAQPIGAALRLELSAFHTARHIEVRLDGRPVQTFVVEPPRRMYEIGPLDVGPGGHDLAFLPVEAPTVAGDAIGNGDRRPLSFAIGTWTWSVRGESP